MRAAAAYDRRSDVHDSTECAYQQNGISAENGEPYCAIVGFPKKVLYWQRLPAVVAGTLWQRRAVATALGRRGFYQLSPAAALRRRRRYSIGNG